MGITRSIIKSVPGLGIDFLSSSAYHFDTEIRSFNYGFAPTPFGPEMLVIWTAVGIRNLDLVKDNRKQSCSTREEAIGKIRRKYWPDSTFILDNAAATEFGKFIFDKENAPILWGEGEREIPLDLFGSPFQLKVWNTLSKVPYGNTVSYSELAAMANCPRAVRAVATAVGQNPITYLVPCHRVLPKGGGIGQFGWGPDIKRKMLEWEQTLNYLT